MMKPSSQFDASKLPRHKVELHLHLDSTIRLETLWELAQEKNTGLCYKSQEDLSSACRVETGSTLFDFLKPFNIFLPLIAGDRTVIERIAYEFCEDAAKEGTIYAEIRYNPQLLSSTEGSSARKSLSPREVVESVNRGLSRGSAAFGIKVRSILSCIRGKSGWSDEILSLCNEYKEKGVVGIDICGDKDANSETNSHDIEIFKKAAALGIHRTAHAGEDGPASQVRLAIRELGAERIGHGYHVVDDPQIYVECLQAGVHFETCPWSSLLTGSVTHHYSKHPIVKFAEDGANFSISRDNPTIIQKSLEEDYELLRSLGLRDVHFARANFNAARSAFLPPDEKQDLIAQLCIAYGVPESSGIFV